MNKILKTFIAFVSIFIIGCTSDEIVQTKENDVLTRATSQTIFSNQNVTSDRIITGTDILSENVTVSNGAKLTLKADQSITINRPYTIEKGCQLEITH